MSYKNRNHGRGRRSPRLDQLTRIERMVKELLRRSGIEMDMEFEQMADFSALLEKVTKIKGRVESNAAFIAGLKKQLTDAAAGMNDEEDQAKINALVTDLDAVADQILPAVDANPLPTDSPVGGSTGGIRPTE